MKVALNITRVKRENEIDEIFHYNPDHQFCYDDKREIHYRLWHKRNQLSIHKIGYKLIQITYLNKQIIYTFEFDNELPIPAMYESHTIDYNPVMGQKKCTKCKYKVKNYCSVRGKEVNKHSYYKCTYWMEKEVVNVFKPRKTS